MRRLVILASLVALGACSAQISAPNRNVRPDSTLRKDGIPCVTEDGRSGYLVTAGDRCQAS